MEYIGVLLIFSDTFVIYSPLYTLFLSYYLNLFQGLKRFGRLSKTMLTAWTNRSLTVGSATRVGIVTEELLTIHGPLGLTSSTSIHGGLSRHLPTLNLLGRPTPTVASFATQASRRNSEQQKETGKRRRNQTERGRDKSATTSHPPRRAGNQRTRSSGFPSTPTHYSAPEQPIVVNPDNEIPSQPGDPYAHLYSKRANDDSRNTGGMTYMTEVSGTRIPVPRHKPVQAVSSVSQRKSPRDLANPEGEDSKVEHPHGHQHNDSKGKGLKVNNSSSSSSSLATTLFPPRVGNAVTSFGVVVPPSTPSTPPDDGSITSNTNAPPIVRTRETVEMLKEGATWLPLRRKRTELSGLDEEAALKLKAFEATLPCVLHEDTTRVLALPKELGGMGFSRLTGVQERVIPQFAQGIDMLVRAATGTGKTMAYLVPLIERLIYSRSAPDSRAIYAVILVPTREIALQVSLTASHLLAMHRQSGERRFDVCCLFGSRSSVHTEQQALGKANASILIGMSSLVFIVSENYYHHNQT